MKSREEIEKRIKDYELALKVIKKVGRSGPALYVWETAGKHMINELKWVLS